VTQRNAALNVPLWRGVGAFLRMVKIEHSIFALPFAYIGLFLAAGGWPGWQPFLLLSLAMVAVRTWAMAVNRLADLSFDRKNPRTQTRPLVSGELSTGPAWSLCALTAIVFVLACAGLNTLCLILSPVALAWSGLYSLSKRFTWLAHFWLGSVLGLAPLGGWLAVEPAFTLPAVLFFLGVLFWVAGFDILYACQDVDFDRLHGLHSVPARFGLVSALHLSTFSHVNASLFYLLAGRAGGLGSVYLLFWLLVSSLLIWEHKLVGPEDLSRVNTAFFTFNGAIAVLLFVGVLADLLISGA